MLPKYIFEIFCLLYMLFKKLTASVGTLHVTSHRYRAIMSAAADMISYMLVYEYLCCSETHDSDGLGDLN